MSANTGTVFLVPYKKGDPHPGSEPEPEEEEAEQPEVEPEVEPEPDKTDTEEDEDADLSLAELAGSPSPRSVRFPCIRTAIARIRLYSPVYCISARRCG